MVCSFLFLVTVRDGPCSGRFEKVKVLHEGSAAPVAQKASKDFREDQSEPRVSAIIISQKFHKIISELLDLLFVFYMLPFKCSLSCFAYLSVFIPPPCYLIMKANFSPLLDTISEALSGYMLVRQEST